MEITTKETSLQLIAAGMPVPRPQVGQFWYDADGEWHLVFAVCKSFADYITECGKNDQILNPNNFVPAFTASDILRELGSIYSISFIGDNRGFYIDNVNSISELFFNCNPAEAAALAYLAKKQRHAAQPTTTTEV